MTLAYACRRNCQTIRSEKQELLWFHEVPPPSLGFLQRQESRFSLFLGGKPVQPGPTALPYPAPNPLQGPFAKQVWQHGHVVEPGLVASGIAFFEVCVHGQYRKALRDSRF